jgi:hypothetical protein
VTVFIDTAILMYAGGTEHPLREPCQRVLEAVADGRVEAVTSVEVVQEILHRFTALGRAEVGAAMAQATLDLFAPVLPITHAVMRRMPDLIERYQGLAARDLVHVATCLEEGIADIVSPDRGLDAVPEIHRIAPDTSRWT